MSKNLQEGCAIDSVIALAFPGLQILSNERKLETGDAFELAKKYVKTFYPKSSCSIIYGSYARHEQNNLSDLDLVVIVEEYGPGRGAEMVKDIFEGVRVESCIFTEAHFQEVLLREVVNGPGAFHAATTEGILLTGSNELIKNFRKVANKCHAKKRLHTDPIVLRLRTQVSFHLLKLSMLRDHFEKIQYATFVYFELCQSILFVETGVAVGVNRMHNEFSAIDKGSAESLRLAYLNVCVNGRTDEFIGVAEKLLARAGGACWSKVTEPFVRKKGLAGFVNFMDMIRVKYFMAFS